MLRWALDHGCEWDWLTCALAAAGGHLEVLKWARAGNNTRPLFSSAEAVSDAKYTLNIPNYPLIPQKHPLNNP